MPTAIQILVEGQVLPGELNDSETAKALLGRLPLRIRMSRWGDEYYGSIGEPLDVAPAPDARDEMAVGELAYWIPGNALCIFFGPTPASEGDEPRAASAVNPLGMVTGPAEALALKDLGATVTAEVAAAG
jgi:hypothetical protein